MLSYAILLAMSLAGYTNGPGWLILAGAAGLTLGSWRPWRLSRQSRTVWTSKTATYFVTGVLVDLGLAAFSFGAGRVVRAILG